eukprot:3733006-Prymnesium_polylepis.1
MAPLYGCTLPLAGTAAQSKPLRRAAISRCRLPDIHRPAAGTHLTGILPKQSQHASSSSPKVRILHEKCHTFGQTMGSRSRELITVEASSMMGSPSVASRQSSRGEARRAGVGSASSRPARLRTA